MRRTLVLTIALALASGAPTAGNALAQARGRAASRCCRVPAGAVLMVELAQEVSTRTQKRGDTFPIRLAEPLTANGRIVLEAGATGVGEVIDAAKPGLGGKGAKLVLAARSLQGPGGAVLPLKGLQLSGAGKGRQGAATALGLGGIGFAPLGFVGFAIRGGDVSFPAGTKATAKLARSATLASLGPAPKGLAARPERGETPALAVDLPSPPRGQGQIVFFRKKSLLGTGQWFNVREDGRALGKLTNGAYFVQPAEPGLHTFTAKTEPEFNDQLRLKVDAGETYFVEGILTKGVVIGVAALTPSDRAAFADAAKTLKPADGPGEDQLEERPEPGR